MATAILWVEAGDIKRKIFTSALFIAEQYIERMFYARLE
jgi:hypothetical protein